MRRACLAALLVVVVAADSQMTLARRLFLAGSGGSFVATPSNPPTDASWVRVASNPIMSPTGWEGLYILEPTILYEDGVWKMIYSGHAEDANTRFGYATSPDGVTWTRQNSGNPVFGGGAGGQSGGVLEPSLFKVSSTYRLYYRTLADGHLNIAESSDLLSWSVTHTDILPFNDSQTEWDNTSIVLDGSTYYMLAEALRSGIYQTYLWSSSDGISWTAGNGGSPLTTLQQNSGGMWGGPNIWPRRINGLWHIWYHAAEGSGNLPTSIYHATSPDLVTWTKTAPAPVLQRAGSGFEIDQVADPDIHVVGPTAYLFYTGVNNPAFSGSIGLATAPAV